MRIGIVCYPTYGGSGVVATELGLGMAKNGHSVHFITYSQPARLNAFQQNVFYHEVRAADYPLFEYLPYETALASKLVDVVKYENLDLLHVHYAVPHASVAYTAREILLEQGRYIPIVTTLHGTDITLVGTDPSFAPVVAFSINHSDGVTAVSQSLKQQTLDSFDIHNDIRVIYNFIDFSRFSRLNKDHFKKAIAPQGERILIHISNFRKVKRVSDVIHIYKKVQDEIPAKLLLVGDGPERGRMENLCRDLQVCGGVHFLGKQDAIEELLAVGDLLIMPSETESFGLAALEAMACQVPVIATKVGGLPEVVVHAESGYLSAVGHVDEMAANALSLLTNEQKLIRFRENALARAKQFDIKNILQRYEDYYSEVIEKASLHSHA